MANVKKFSRPIFVKSCIIFFAILIGVLTIIVSFVGGFDFSLSGLSAIFQLLIALLLIFSSIAFCIHGLFEKVYIYDDFIVYKKRNKKVKIDWNQIKQVKVIKSTASETFEAKNAAQFSNANLTLRDIEYAGQEVIWKILIIYQISSSKTQTLEIIKNYFKKSSLMLKEIIVNARRFKAEVDIAEYIEKNPSFKSKNDIDI